MNRAYNVHLFTRMPGRLALVRPGVGWIVDNLSDSRANNIYSPGSDKLTEVHCTTQLHVKQAAV